MQRPEDRYGGSPPEIWNNSTAPPPVYGTFPEQCLHQQQPPLVVAPSYPIPVPPEQPPYHVVQGRFRTVIFPSLRRLLCGIYDVYSITVGYQSYGCPVEPTVMTDGVPLKLVRVRERSLPCCGIGLGWAL